MRKIDAATDLAGGTGPVCRLEGIEVIRAGDMHVDDQCVARFVTEAQVGKREMEADGWFYRPHYGKYKNDFKGDEN